MWPGQASTSIWIRSESATTNTAKIRHVPGDALVRGLMLTATAAWACAECLALRRPGDSLARSFYTAAAALAVVHVLAAFHITYGWSHERALADTAQQTAAVAGLAWGGGLFVNYAFLFLWLADAAWWWVAPVRRARRSAALERTRLFLFTFMFINGAIVFAGLVGRMVGIPAVAAVATAWARTARAQTVRA
jgi:hypothetical protein